jgi:hypothetical protein
MGAPFQHPPFPSVLGGTLARSPLPDRLLLLSPLLSPCPLPHRMRASSASTITSTLRRRTAPVAPYLLPGARNSTRSRSWLQQLGYDGAAKVVGSQELTDEVLSHACLPPLARRRTSSHACWTPFQPAPA